MSKTLAAASLLLAALLLLSGRLAPNGALAQPPQFVPRDENPEEFPPGPGRDDTASGRTRCN